MRYVFKYCRNLTPAKCQESFYGQGYKTGQATCTTIPAMNATSEKTFSTLRYMYIQNYLQTTMFQECLNNLMVTYTYMYVHVYKDRLDLLDHTSIAQDLVNGRECRCFNVWFF